MVHNEHLQMSGSTLVQPPPIDLRDASCQQQKVHVVWHAPNGYSFVQGGITVTGSSTQFSQSHPGDENSSSAKDKKYHVLDANSDGQQYEYTISLVPDSGGRPVSKDPIIINAGSH